MFKRLVKLYKCDEDVKYSLSELARIIGVTLPEMSQLSHKLIEKGVLVNTEDKIVFSRVQGKISEIKVKAFKVNLVALDKVIFDEFEEGRVLFDRAHKYINRLDLRVTSKLEKE
jgi:hypothetical protein